LKTTPPPAAQAIAKIIPKPAIPAMRFMELILNDSEGKVPQNFEYPPSRSPSAPLR
jgi:hypothetical protein